MIILSDFDISDSKCYIEVTRWAGGGIDNGRIDMHLHKFSDHLLCTPHRKLMFLK